MDTFRVICWIAICLIAVVSLCSYLLTSITYYSLSKQLGIGKRQLAFVPIVNYCLFANIQNKLGNKSNKIFYLIVRILEGIFLVVFVLKVEPLYMQFLTLPKSEIFDVAYYNNPQFLLAMITGIFMPVLIPCYVISCIFKSELITAVKKSDLKHKQFVVFSSVLSFAVLPASFISIMVTVICK